MFSREGKKSTPIPKLTEKDECVSKRPYRQRPDTSVQTPTLLWDAHGGTDVAVAKRLKQSFRFWGMLSHYSFLLLALASSCYSCSHRVMWSSLILAVIFWLILDTAKLGNQQLVSFGGLVMYIILLFLFSKHPTRVSTDWSQDKESIRL